MIDSSQSAPIVRVTTREDVPDLVQMVRELAEFEKLSDLMVASVADYEKALFGETPAAEALVAEVDGQLVGYAIFFSTFSSFLGKAGIWLEDLYVRPKFRKLGIGKELLFSVGDIAEARGAGRYEWCVLDWNQNAIDLYTQVGGEILEEWKIVRLESDGLRSLRKRSR
ncbi:MAG: GNAT family N-acetyltransferase [Verrucomicrobiales bacterium]|jgi:GNAT superfamily N-acetyltransferase|nr:GNAT family N-acetyltransferase [Verrucomicrobiales bacterium]